MRTMRFLGLCATAIGLWLMLAPVILYPQGSWQNLVNDLAAGTLTVGAGVWRAYGTRGANWTQRSLAVLGTLEFLSPWLYGQTLEPARWNAWLCGLLLIGIAATITAYRPVDQPLHFTLVPDLFPGEPDVINQRLAIQRRLRRIERRDRRRRQQLARLQQGEGEP
ncbi:MAG: SPW repeat protein [Candidatus Sericytochromatia bacterium]|nr:SPW repeat protein [Candidatus Sericytochromatia bacterium]